jgi:hypothetical protein
VHLRILEGADAFDLLAAVLLLARQILGVMLTVAIITSDVVLNGWVGGTRGFQLEAFVARSLFLVFVLATARLRQMSLRRLPPLVVQARRFGAMVLVSLDFAFKLGTLILIFAARFRFGLSMVNVVLAQLSRPASSPQVCNRHHAQPLPRFQIGLDSDAVLVGHGRAALLEPRA